MQTLETQLQQLMPAIDAVISASPVAGGCISRAQQVRCRIAIESGEIERSLFVKSNVASFLDNFRCEWDGLARLHEADAIGAPMPLAIGEVDGKAWLVLSWIDQRPTNPGFFTKFGQRLADLHRATSGTKIGLGHDNFLGAALQVNTACSSWNQFVADHRLGPQLQRAVDQGLADTRLRKDVETIISSIDELLDGRDELTCLLHGDLWSGNYLCGSDGQPVILDPAVYHGCREAEFGMLRLFGSCPDEFYDAYQEAFPMPAGCGRRVKVYVLYHLLNHLNLFGGGYRGQCQQTASEILE